MKLRRNLLIFVLVVVLLPLCFYFIYMSPRRVTPILMYHAVDDTPDNSLYVSPENFDKQMKYLHDSGYSVISLDELIKNIEKGKHFIKKTVVITFDDGYEDNYLYAFPVLEKYNMPATIFIISGDVGKKNEYLNWDQVNLMRKHSIDFGGHTRSNVYLPSIKDEKKLWDEIVGAKKDIEAKTGTSVNYFCYPTGGFHQTIKDMVKKAGYKAACTTNRGFDRMNTDLYELNRVKITNSDTVKPLHFKAKLSGFYNLFRKLRPGS